MHKSITRKINERKVQSSFIDTFWRTDLADTKLISTFNKGVCFLLRVIHIFSKYASVVSLKDTKCIKITNALQKILKESNCKPNKI